jgi:hypothetical protein
MFSELFWESENTGLCRIVHKRSFVVYDLRMHLHTLYMANKKNTVLFPFSSRCPHCIDLLPWFLRKRAFSCGRIPANEVRGSIEVVLVLLDAKAAVARHRARLMVFGCDVDIQQSTLHVATRSYMDMISHYFMSYDKFSMPYVFYHLLRVEDPTAQFSKEYYTIR